MIDKTPFRSRRQTLCPGWRLERLETSHSVQTYVHTISTVTWPSVPPIHRCDAPNGRLRTSILSPTVLGCIQRQVGREGLFALAATQQFWDTLTPTQAQAGTELPDNYGVSAPDCGPRGGCHHSSPGHPAEPTSTARSRIHEAHPWYKLCSMPTTQGQMRQEEAMLQLCQSWSGVSCSSAATTTTEEEASSGKGPSCETAQIRKFAPRTQYKV